MVEKILTVEDGVKKLLSIREIPHPEKMEMHYKTEEELVDTLVLGEDRIPLPYWRYEFRIFSMNEYGKENPDDNCMLNVYSYVGKHETLLQHLYRELDIAEFLLCSRIKKVTAFKNGDACNLIAVTEAGTTANLELGATMAPGTINQCQHRLLTTRGMACDRPVESMVAESSTYLFASDSVTPREFNDLEYYLWGLGADDVVRVTYIQDIIKNNVNVAAIKENDAHLRRVIAAVLKSDEIGDTVVVEEEGV